MKLIIAIVQDLDAPMLIEGLMEGGFRVTKLATTGGFLRSGNTTLLMGVDDEKVQEALNLIEKHCQKRKAMTPIVPADIESGQLQPLTMEIEIGGASVFVVDVEDFVRF